MLSTPASSSGQGRTWSHVSQKHSHSPGRVIPSLWTVDWALPFLTASLLEPTETLLFSAFLLFNLNSLTHPWGCLPSNTKPEPSESIVNKWCFPHSWGLLDLIFLMHGSPLTPCVASGGGVRAVRKTDLGWGSVGYAEELCPGEVCSGVKKKGLCSEGGGHWDGPGGLCPSGQMFNRATSDCLKAMTYVSWGGQYPRDSRTPCDFVGTSCQWPFCPEQCRSPFFPQVPLRFGGHRTFGMVSTEDVCTLEVVCVCVCVHGWTCTRMYVWVYAYMCVHTCINVRKCVCNMCVFVCIWVWIVCIWISESLNSFLHI